MPFPMCSSSTYLLHFIPKHVQVIAPKLFKIIYSSSCFLLTIGYLAFVPPFPFSLHMRNSQPTHVKCSILGKALCPCFWCFTQRQKQKWDKDVGRILVGGGERGLTESKGALADYVPSEVWFPDPWHVPTFSMTRSCVHILISMALIAFLDQYNWVRYRVHP